MKGKPQTNNSTNTDLEIFNRILANAIKNKHTHTHVYIYIYIKNDPWRLFQVCKVGSAFKSN